MSSAVAQFYLLHGWPTTPDPPARNSSISIGQRHERTQPIELLNALIGQLSDRPTAAGRLVMLERKY